MQIEIEFEILIILYIVHSEKVRPQNRDKVNSKIEKKQNAPESIFSKHTFHYQKKRPKSSKSTFKLYML